ncbi:hypothetical protein EC844_11864 [Acinetobacter calcoaceticus]|uniref:Uncharacterized protein n=1 Tax=Acinetobacter calcoaceticus TaxID=471 RepID=A0A4V2R0F2_ACICA|nr:hypothetical protein EC844_11864 [Acinetobacter calcoaceticus]
MKKWKCPKCKKYKPIKHSDTKIGDIIFFYIDKIKGSKIEKILKRGDVIGIQNKIVSVNYSGGVYQCDILNTYPFRAPAQIVYNIFGTCCCDE